MKVDSRMMNIKTTKVHKQSDCSLLFRLGEVSILSLDEVDQAKQVECKVSNLNKMKRLQIFYCFHPRLTASRISKARRTAGFVGS